ncbi:unnamed protein product [Aphanomyces euteiches]|uniref:Uncharacterized protein n=1 Tax=Aphanomyces euteiches TaxID=100861 RepID=A0A6G0XYU5_9STRA|nr:hypothetical protein Ae201684_000208 [Aphanomyces euteiches]KAH9091686.1 hypothetical protein Ae201684P_011230 [Aphanomyces euteiches]KAH9157332.1 hypothetical protein AeRB84_000804 [Aphanomyces euteiches]
MRPSRVANIQLELGLATYATTWTTLLSSLSEARPRQSVGNVGRLLFIIHLMREADLLSLDEYSALKDRIIKKVLLSEDGRASRFEGKRSSESARPSMSRPISSSREQRRRHCFDQFLSV